MSSSRRGFLFLALLCGTPWGGFGLGNAETTYSVNGQSFIARGGQLLDDVEGLVATFEVGTDRPRWASGGTSAARMVFRFAEYYDQGAENSTTDYLFEPMSSGQAARAVLNGHLDWAALGRPLLLAEKADGLTEKTIAWDALTILVPVELAVDSLTVVQVASIFTGEVQNWKEVGGPDLAIVPFGFSERSGLAGAFRDLVLEPSYGDDGRLAGHVRLLSFDLEVFEKVSRTPGSIGFCLRSTEGYEGKKPPRVLPINAVEPSAEAILSGRYPLARPLNFVVRGEPTGKSAQFLDMLLTERVQGLLPQVKLVSAQ